MSNEGFFIVFEGGEGAGKSTLTEAIGKRLENSGRSFVVIREPGGTPVAETLREILKTPLTPWGEALAFLTARSDLIEKVIEIGKQGLQINRYKGLGEMNPEQLWETTLDKNFRSLLMVKLDEVDQANEIFETLMGEITDGRKTFIQENSLKVANLDI